jgi:hypothetical protein
MTSDGSVSGALRAFGGTSRYEHWPLIFDSVTVANSMKCGNGLPCLNCQRMRIDCNLPRSMGLQSSVFINTTVKAQRIRNVSAFAPGDERSRMMHFVLDFFHSRQFIPVTLELYGNGLFDLINRSAPLYCACVALYAAAQKNHTGYDSAQKRKIITHEVCPRAYIKSMELLRQKLPNPQSTVQLSAYHQSSLLWATFFLSLVEVRLPVCRCMLIFTKRYR